MAQIASLSCPSARYKPPRPQSIPAVAALIRALWRGDGDLLGLLPDYAYRVPMGPLGYSRRSTFIVNDPDLVREVLTERPERFPKSDLMVNALEPLIGDSIFVSGGDVWRRQRAMIDPSFSAMRINRAFEAMSAAVDDCERSWDKAAEGEQTLSLDLAMSQLTADIICRTVFSISLASDTAREVFDAFTRFEKKVAQVKIMRLIWDKAWTRVPQEAEVLEACGIIRSRLEALVDRHLQAAPGTFNDIASSVIDARDAETGEGFTRDELVDQLGVMFLAGHETTASALTWAFFILATRPEIAARLRGELDAVIGDGPVTIEHTKALSYTRNVFRETLRLYPPITFLPRVAAEDCTLGGRSLRRGALIMVAPWTLQRHQSVWNDPDIFDPDRFLPGGEAAEKSGAYIPFGQGPRICVGQAFAMVESVLILARLMRRYDLLIEQPDAVRPAARLTTRPQQEIACRVRLIDRAL